MPHAFNPGKGWVGTTNNRTVASDFPYYYSTQSSTSYRQRRLIQLMQTPDKKSAEDHWAYQQDTVNMKAKALLSIISGALSRHPETVPLGKILVGWDGHDSPDQPGPTVFHMVFDEFARLVFIDELGQELTDTLLPNRYYWEERLQEMMASDSSPWFDDTRTPDRLETRDDLLFQAALNVSQRLRAELGQDPAQWLWGKVHRYTWVSPIMRHGALKNFLGSGPHPASGSGDTLCRSLYAFGDPADIEVAASLRMVADLGDADKVLAVLPGGVSGRQFDPHFTDQIKPYLTGEPLYWWFSDVAIQSHKQHELVLKPQ
jgi:penicillin amidase